MHGIKVKEKNAFKDQRGELSSFGSLHTVVMDGRNLLGRCNISYPASLSTALQLQERFAFLYFSWRHRGCVGGEHALRLARTFSLRSNRRQFSPSLFYCHLFISLVLLFLMCFVVCRSLREKNIVGKRGKSKE